MSNAWWNDLQNSHAGATGIVIGNGASLRDIPVEFLKSYPSIGTNRIYLLDDFVPTYYVAVNLLVIAQYLQDIQALPCHKFINATLAPSVENSYALKSLGGIRFSRDIEEGVYEGGTVTYVALQLAHYLGFTRVILVGVDHAYTFTGNPNEVAQLEGPDVNHFDQSYFTGMSWHNPDLSTSEVAYRLAKETYEADGRAIVNCSTRTELKVFELDDWRNYERNVAS